MNNLSSQKIPEHIAIIMDGNSRWAKMRGLDVVFGHREGAERVKDITRFCRESGVRYLSLFAFSTENWQRPGREVDALMDLLVRFLNSQLGDMKKNNIKFLTAGRKKNFKKDVNKALDYAVRETELNTGLTLVLFLDYGGRQEVIDSAIGVSIELEEEDYRHNLYLPELPDVDLLIRTSGEERISNFMLWQLAYSELYFTPELWPDFKKCEFMKAIKSYNRRQRRFGMRV